MSCAAALFFGAALCAAGAQGESQLYGATAGPHRAETVETLTLGDTTGGRRIPIRVTYPREGGPFPVIVFSSIWAGTKDDFEPLIAHWVSHGYVCIRPVHSDSRHFGGRRAFMPPIDAQDRPREVTFILDHLDQISAKASRLQGKIDRRSVGVGGIYVGAATALYLGGMRIVEGSEEQLGSFRDPRVDAVLAMGPSGRGSGVTEASFAAIRVPLMVITGPQDGSSRGHPAEWRTEAYLFSPPGNKYLGLIEGAGGSYGELGGNPEMLDRNISLVMKRLGLDADERHVVEQMLGDLAIFVRSLTVAFWDAHLKGDRRALRYLESGAIEEAGMGSLELNVK